MTALHVRLTELSNMPAEWLLSQPEGTLFWVVNPKYASMWEVAANGMHWCLMRNPDIPTPRTCGNDSWFGPQTSWAPKVEAVAAMADPVDQDRMRMLVSLGAVEPLERIFDDVFRQLVKGLDYDD